MVPVAFSMKNPNDFLSRIAGKTFRERCECVCRELRSWDARYNWVGIYWVDGGELVLGPWSGPRATEHVRIPLDRGLCGAAVREGRTIIVDDVSQDPRYLACFLETHSEIVVPIRAEGKIIGEIDIDGDAVGAFDDSDREFLEQLADHIGNEWPGAWQ